MSGKKKPRGISEAFSQIRADYDATKTSRFNRTRRGLAPAGGPADYHFRNERSYYDLIEKARDMDRNDCVIGQTIDRATFNIVQDGFVLDPQTGDKKVDLDLWQWWQSIANEPEMCDVAGESSFHDFEFMGARSLFCDGDSVVAGTENGPFQFFEGHTIQTSTTMPDTFLGVTMDEHRRRLKYWYQADSVDAKKSKKEQAISMDVRDSDGIRQLFHIYKAGRQTLTRGVTALAPVFSIAGMFEDAMFATLLKQQVASCFAIFRELNPSAPSGTLPSTDTGYGDSSTEQSPSGETRYIEGVAPAMEVTGLPGEKLHMDSPKIPNTEFFQHMELILQIIGVNLGLPLCLVLMDGSETNFSGWRGAVDQARKGFEHQQRNLIKRLHTPAYIWRLNKRLDEDPILKAHQDKKKVNLFGHKWHAPTWPYIEPVKDAEGDLLRVKNALISPRRLHAERSRDWEEIAEESIADNAYAIERAKKTADVLNKKYPSGNPIQWRDLISLPTPEGVTISSSSTEAIEPSEPAMPQAKNKTRKPKVNNA